MPKNCRRTLRRFIFVLNSCVHFALRNAIVRASCQIVSSSSLLRVIIGAIGHFSPHEDNTKETRSCPIAIRLREALAMPSCSHRIIVRWHRDGTTVSAKTAEFEQLKRFLEGPNNIFNLPEEKSLPGDDVPVPYYIVGDNVLGIKKRLLNIVWHSCGLRVFCGYTNSHPRVAFVCSSGAIV